MGSSNERGQPTVCPGRRRDRRGQYTRPSHNRCRRQARTGRAGVRPAHDHDARPYLAASFRASAHRGQHIERWTSPREAYVEGRVGYLKWRKDLQDFHARRLSEIMAAAGYGEEDIGRVGALVRKERLKSDAEAQTLEDVACLVFLAHYIDDFMTKTDPDKLAGIL